VTNVLIIAYFNSIYIVWHRCILFLLLFILYFLSIFLIPLSIAIQPFKAARVF